MPEENGINFEKHFKELSAFIESRIMSFVPSAQKEYGIIEEAMKYSLESGGKRVRPMLVLEFCRILGGDINEAMAFAAGVEFIQTYSLIHVDLHFMDKVDFRRGKPSSHKKFGEASALLAGDALLTHAFSCLASFSSDWEKTAKAVKVLSDFAGINGMIGGQIVDMNDMIPSAEKFGENLGLAFQIIDDILDFLEGESSSDIVSGKSTYVSLLGMEKAGKTADEYTDKALAVLDSIDADTEFLKEFAVKLLKRNA